MPEEYFRTIEHFENYAVSDYGRVMNVDTQELLTLSPTEYGELTVGLTREGKQHRRSVKVLVARAFVPGETRVFDTPILLDGNRDNLHAKNIQWRPRWFAIVYVQQFTNPQANLDVGPIYNVFTEEVYDNVLEAAMATGSLARDIRSSLLNETRVFPTGAIFRFC